MNAIEEITQELERQKLWDGELTLPRNEYLKEKGSIDTKLYFVVEGSLRVFIMDENEEQTIRFGYRNNLIASLDSYITNKPSDLSIQAIKKTKLKVISKDRFMAFIWSSKENLTIWFSIINGLVLQQMERERDILTTSPVERYKRVLKRSPQLFQEIPHKYIASYLRMSAETLSRIKKS